MLQGYRTIIFNILVGIAGIVGNKVGMDAQTQAAAITAISTLGNIGLRFLTKGPVGQKVN